LRPVISGEIAEKVEEFLADPDIKHDKLKKIICELRYNLELARSIPLTAKFPMLVVKLKSIKS